MGLRQRIISEIYDESNNKVVNREIIKDKEIKKPQVIEDLGYDHKEQVDILQHVLDAFLGTQSQVFVSEECRSCGGKTSKAGHIECDFHSVYTDHRVKVPRRECKICGKRSRDTIHSMFGSSMHPDLIKKQAMIGASFSFMDAQKCLELENGKYRKINNHLTVQNNVDKVGRALSLLHMTLHDMNNTIPAARLVVQVDGGHIKSKTTNSFEALVSNVYNPKDHKMGYINDNGNRVSGVLEEKIYSVSTLKDRGKAIKEMTLVAASKQGLTEETHVTALSDGAKNCWNVLKALERKTKKIEYILDWCHIKRKFEALDIKIEKKEEKAEREELKSIKWKIWHGEYKEAIKRLNELNLRLLSTDYSDQTSDLLKYLVNNKKYLVNYNKRMEAKLPYTSSVIESTIETLVNDRHKKKHKAQWTREGAHNVLQIRSSIASNKWDMEWGVAKWEIYRKVA